MTNSNTFKLDERVIERRKPLRGFPYILIFGLMVVSFTGGVIFERSGITRKSVELQTRKTEPAVVSDEITAPEAADPQTIEARLTEQVRSIYSEVSRLDEEAKEDRIHYNLLLQRGYAESDDACAALVSRQKELKDEIERLQNSADEAETLRRRLRDRLRNVKDSDCSTGIQEDLRNDVLRYIARTSLNGASATIVSDDDWMGVGNISEMSTINDQ